METYLQFQSERLLIRPTNLEGTDFIIELVNSPKWLTYIGNRCVLTTSDAKEYIENKVLSQFNRLGYGNYTLIRKEDGVKVGSAGLYDRDGLDGIDIGFALLPQHEKRGYAFEASLIVRNAAFLDFGLNEIGAITTKDNVGSQTLLDRLGLSFLNYTKLPEDEEALMFYSLKKSDWEQLQTEY